MTVLEQPEHNDAERREGDAQTLPECWHNAVVNGFGAGVCEQLAAASNKR
jgi:hypothetical protein